MHRTTPSPRARPRRRILTRATTHSHPTVIRRVESITRSRGTMRIGHRPARRPSSAIHAGLATLFGTEMWERFSWYGLRAILATFMAASPAAGGLGLTEADRARRSSASTARSIYLVALPGGWIADRRPRRPQGGAAAAASSSCAATSAWPSPSDGRSSSALGLLLIIVGHRPAQAEHLRDGRQALPRRGRRAQGRRASRSSTWASTSAPSSRRIVVGWLAADDRWHLGFGAAAVGMALGLLQYVLGRAAPAGRGRRARPPADPRGARHFGLTVSPPSP